MYWRVPYILNLGVVFFLETPYEPIVLDMETYIYSTFILHRN